MIPEKATGQVAPLARQLSNAPSPVKSPQTTRDPRRPELLQVLAELLPQLRRRADAAPRFEREALHLAADRLEVGHG